MDTPAIQATGSSFRHPHNATETAAVSIQKNIRARQTRAKLMNEILDHKIDLGLIEQAPENALQRVKQLFKSGAIKVTQIAQSVQILSSPIGQFFLTMNPQQAIEAINDDIHCDVGAGFIAFQLAGITNSEALFDQAMEHMPEQIDHTTESSPLLNIILRFSGVPAANRDSGLMVCLFLKRAPLAEKFIAHGAKVSLINATGNTSLNIAARQCPSLIPSIAAALKTEGAFEEHLNRPTDFGKNTPLHHAAIGATATDQSAFTQLLALGATDSLTLRNEQGQTPGEILKAKGIDMESLLERIS